MCAAKNGQLPMVEYLLERGADANVQDNVNEQLDIHISIMFIVSVRSKDGMHCT